MRGRKNVRQNTENIWCVNIKCALFSIMFLCRRMRAQKKIEMQFYELVNRRLLRSYLVVSRYTAHALQTLLSTVAWNCS